VHELTLPGKKPVNGKAFFNGLNGREARWIGTDEEATAGSDVPPAGSS